MSEEDKLSLVSRMLAEGKKDTAIATAIGGTRHEARMLLAQVQLAQGGQTIGLARTGALALYEAACRALAEAKAADEVMAVRDRAEALRLCARVAKNRAMEIDAAEIRLRAERRLGEMIAGQKATVGLHPGGRPKTGSREEQVSDPPPTLADMDIDRKLSMRAQRLAAVPQEQFETELSGWRERVAQETERVTVSLLRKGEDAQRRQAVHDQTPCRLSEWPTRQYEIILIDVPRARHAYSSETGLHKAPDNHYRTMSFEELLDLRVADIAAPDSMLLKWSTASSLIDDIELMAEYGFLALRPRGADGKILRADGRVIAGEPGAPVPPRGEGKYSSHQIWRKVYPGANQHGMGLRFWDVHEILLVGLRGRFPGPIKGQQPLSVFDAPWRGHSVKPDEVRDWVDKHHPDKTKIELFARGKARPGWHVFGNQAESGATGVTAAGHPHLWRALARVGQQLGDTDPRTRYEIQPHFTGDLGAADSALSKLTTEEFERICRVDDPAATHFACSSPELELVLDILSDFASSEWPESAE